MTETQTIASSTPPSNTGAAAPDNTPLVAGLVADTKAAGDGTTPPADAGTDGKTDGKTDAPTGAPEKYEFKAPEGRQFDNEVIASFSEVAKELNLSQESAQKVLDKMAPKVAERQQAQLQMLRQEWESSSKSDKEFGGEKITENLGIAKKALDAFGTPELRTLLEQSGLGNHPEFIRLLYRAGKSISEDNKLVGAGSTEPRKANSGSRDFASAAAALYGT